MGTWEEFGFLPLLVVMIYVSGTYEVGGTFLSAVLVTASGTNMFGRTC
jgi:hypothetical protein